MSSGILSLGLMEFLTRIASKNHKRMGILLIRGGLGNQLHQLAALAYYSTQYDFVPVVYTYDVERSFRDGRFASFESLNMAAFFPRYNKLRKPNKTLRFLLRVHLSLLRRSGKTFALDDRKLQEGSHERSGNQFYIQDYFENKRYAQELDFYALQELFVDSDTELKVTSNIDYSDRILLHLRFTDSHKPSDSLHNSSDYSKVLRMLGRQQERLIVDCYSDDIDAAKIFLDNLVEEFQINFPEKEGYLKSPELLKHLTRYGTIVSSRSTLLWWTCFIASCCSRNKSIVYCSFPDTLKLDSWNTFFDSLH
jgi:hypothetical protein